MEHLCTRCLPGPWGYSEDSTQIRSTLDLMGAYLPVTSGICNHLCKYTKIYPVLDMCYITLWGLD